MRIVHVSDCYAPRVGGIESQVADLAAHQVSQGHAVHVLTATAAETGTTTLGRYRETITEPSGVRVHRIASPVSLGLPVHPRGQALIRRALALLEPDVVHVHAGVVSPFAHDGARAARAAGLPLAITWHCMLDGVEPALALGARATGWRSARFAPSAVSGVAAERVAEALGRTDVSVMPNGLDLTPWRAVATGGDRTPSGVSARRGGGGPLRVVATQRLAPRKRAVPLVRTVAQAHERLGRDTAGRPRILLTIAGGGPAEHAVRAEVAAGDLDDVVTVLGRVPRQTLPTLYRAQDVFVAPALLEAFGVAALEARAAGLAVVGQAGTGVSEFVQHEREGLLVDGDEAATDALVRLAEDGELLAGIRAHNAAVPPSMSWAEVIGRANRVYARAREAVGLPGSV
ncbi:glycosyltransferase family 4 protein [Ruania alba]|uniref:D-inositol 3-phosphate glycosyltransferase n=1 Tax=Ruania alba TaxID=648782 RepID=A0A1H5CGE5_9MICO|nr:glycosyltransferase family 4 protein [Ruania alba]SED65410.1 Glycosyltransferase involved in cell wall bisynthesis [Ruania alba]